VTATIIDGHALAAQLLGKVAQRTAELANAGIVPGFAALLADDDAASHRYVDAKARAARACGVAFVDCRLAANATTDQLRERVSQLNSRKDVHGVFVQLPLPAGVDTRAVLDTIDPTKDVDGCSAASLGRIAVGQSGFAACAPLAALLSIKHVGSDLSGQRALVIADSVLIRQPMTQLLLREDCTVTIADSKAAALPQLCADAEIVVASTGRPQSIAGHWIRPGAIVIDMGLNRIGGPDSRKIVGDVDLAGAALRASAIAPAPGGVGPMTIACLLMNTVKAAGGINVAPD
jgi:methylenetetrahydrofolate dehydrogenase (NADP+) / methenyltetrahydrofolate cyclohydrolase